ncbi:MAG: hypothetical protein C0616_08140 [Desulfuromonas sp.]|nr:MAG: hypothetical protein C0616_08140 [Desulfuromonas sp.]
MKKSLRYKVMLLLGMFLGAGLGLGTMLNWQMVLRQFVDLEESHVYHRLTVVGDAYRAELNKLDHLLQDLQAIPAIEDALLDKEKGVLEHYLSNEFMVVNHLNVAFAYDRRGNVVFGRRIDWNRRSEVSIAEFPSDGPPAEPLLVTHQQPGSSRLGLVRTELGVMMVATRPMESRHFQGMATGTLVVGRLFADFEMKLEDRSLVGKVEILKFDMDRPSTEMQFMLDMLKGQVQEDIAPATEDEISGYRLYRALAGEPLFASKVTMPRDEYHVGRETVFWSSIITIASIAFIALVFFVTLQRLIFDPLQELTTQVKGFDEKKSFPLTLPERSDDEIGELSEAFSDLSTRLQTSIDELWQEVRDRRRIESTLRHSEASYRKLSLEFRAVLNGIQDSLMLLDSEQNIVWANDGAVNQLGAVPGFEGVHREGELHGRTLPLNQDSPIPDCLERGEIVERIERWPEGKLYGVKAFPIVTTEGDLRVLRFSTDITEKFKLRLEATRAARLAALGELAAGVAHEINNPNAIVNVNVGLLIPFWEKIQQVFDEVRGQSTTPLVEEVAGSRLWREAPVLLQEMLDGTRRIQGIVDDLKHFVRDQQDYQSEPVDLNQVVKVAIRLTKNLIQKSTSDFNLELAKGSLMVLGRQQQLEQIVINLVQNACHALTDTGQSIRVSSHLDEERQLCTVCVEDCGKGVSPEDAPHLFDPFFTTKREDGGTGLGLSVSFRIAREHGGRLDFTSEKNKGSAFCLELPTYSEEMES